MSENLTKLFTDIADAIREKKRLPASEKIIANTFPGEIQSIQPKLEDKTIDPSITQQEILPDQTGAFDGIGKVTINPVTAGIDTNIKPENIKWPVEILGVEGAIGKPVEAIYSPIYTAIGGRTSDDFDIPKTCIELSGVDLEGVPADVKGYEVSLDEEVEYASNFIDRQEIALDSQYELYGVKMYNMLGHVWQWAYGDPESSLARSFSLGSLSIEKLIDGKSISFDTYANMEKIACGARNARFFFRPIKK